MSRIVLIVFYCISLCVNGQELSLTQFNTRDGLPSSQVYHSFQDDRGYIWFATDRGIAKFNGSVFRVYDGDDGLTANAIFKFFPQQDGKVWCATAENKWFWFQPGEDVFHPYKYNDSLVKYAEGFLYDDFAIRNGTFYFSFENRSGYISISNLGKVKDCTDKSVIFDLDHPTQFYIEFDDAGNAFSYWSNYSINQRILYNYRATTTYSSETSAGLKKSANLNKATSVFSIGPDLYLLKTDKPPLRVPLEKNVIGVGKFDKDHFWVGQLAGGVKIYSNTGVLTAHYCEGASVTGAMRDNNGGLWFSTLEQGVLYANTDRLLKYHIGSDHIYSLSKGKEGILVTTLEGLFVELRNDGIHYYTRTGHPGTHSGVYNKLYDANVMQYLNLPDGQKYDIAAMRKHTFLYVGNHSIPFLGGIIDYGEQIDRPPLIATPTYVYQYLNGKWIQYFPNVSRLKSVNWKGNQILLGTMTGLYIFDPVTGKARKSKLECLNGRIEDIKQFNDVTFIANMNVGLIRWDKNSCRTITTKDGLSSNCINNIWPESERAIWVATNKGLDYIEFTAKGIRIRNLDITHGLPDNDVVKVLLDRGKLWIGTRSGLCAINRNEVESMFSKRTNLFLQWTGLKVGSLMHSMKNKILFSHEEQSIRFIFDACYFANPKALQFRYKWSENGEWIYTTNRFILFTKLQPGDYHLIVQASINKGVWSTNEIVLDFTVLPPFYATWWFRSLLLIFIIGVIYLVFRFRLLIYNGHLVREFQRLIIKKIRPKTMTFVVRHQGKDCRIRSSEVLYVKSDGNYVLIYTADKGYFVREKISKFLEYVPDPFEYVQVNRSYIVRLDKITEYNKKSVTINSELIPVGVTYQKEVSRLLSL